MRFWINIFLLLSLTLLACRRSREIQPAVKPPGKEEMAELNRYFVQKDREVIQNYIERKELKMKETQTGLWYFIDYEGSGKQITDNDKIVMNYKSYLLDGTECYSSANMGPREIILGKTGLEQGLNEGLRLLKPGAKALFILPPYLAHGFVGDGKKIPPRSILVYEIEILEVKFWNDN